MSLDSIARHKGSSDVADGFLEIIRQLGIWIESLSGTNPDAGFDSFAASNYNHGNRSEQADLMEEVILRLQEINSLGPGGSGSSADNKIRIDADDTISKTWDELFATTNEISWGKVPGHPTLGKQIRLIAQMCFTAGQKAYIGGQATGNVSTHAKFNVIGEPGNLVARFETNAGTHKLFFDNKGYLLHTGGVFIMESLDNDFIVRNGSGKGFTTSGSKLYADIIRNVGHDLASQVQSDTTISNNEIVALKDGTVVKKL